MAVFARVLKGRRFCFSWTRLLRSMFMTLQFLMASVVSTLSFRTIRNLVLWWRRRRSREHAIVFTRWPIPGTTKMRLARTLGVEGVSRLKRLMTEALLGELAAPEAARADRLIEVWYSGGSFALMCDWLGRMCPGIVFCQQVCDKDFGACVASAFATAFEAGADRAIVVRADIAGVSVSEIDKASDMLKGDVDIVFGPSRDGGYYLVGMHRRAANELLHVCNAHGIYSGTSGAREAALKAAGDRGIKSEVLSKQLGDIHETEDLADIEVRLRIRMEALKHPQLSIVVPTLNEQANLEATISAAVRGATDNACIEIVVSDGGSTDGTLDMLSTLPSRPWCSRNVRVQVVSGPRGRGAQLARGVAAAKGDILVILHADSLLPSGWDTIVRTVLDKPGVSAGAFGFDLDSLAAGVSGIQPGPFFEKQLRLLRWGTNLRARLLELPYGDQGLFVFRKTLDEVGGVPRQPLLEDVELVKRLKRLGHVEVLDREAGAIVTSARRWREKGYWRTTGGNQLILLGYAMGLSPERLASWYYGA